MSGPRSVGEPIEVVRLSAGQAAGVACARCRYPLYGSVPVEGYRDAVTGAPLDLWSCLECATDTECEGPIHWYSRYVCVICDEVAPRAVIVGRVDGDSGPGYTAYAHLACARGAGRRLVKRRAQLSQAESSG